MLASPFGSRQYPPESPRSSETGTLPDIWASTAFNLLSTRDAYLKFGPNSRTYGYVWGLTCMDGRWMPVGNFRGLSSARIPSHLSCDLESTVQFFAKHLDLDHLHWVIVPNMIGWGAEYDKGTLLSPSFPTLLLSSHRHPPCPKCSSVLPA